MVNGQLVRHVLEELLRYNPFLSLYYSHQYGSPIITGRYEYINYLHQISLYTNAILRKKIRLFIGDEVGLGKTVEAVRIIKFLLNQNPGLRALIIVPAGLVDQWVEQDLYNLGIVKTVRIDENTIIDLYDYYKEHGTIPPGIYIGSMDKLKYSSRDRGGRGRGHKPYYDLVSSIDWDLVVIDEAHRLTNPLSRRPTLRFERLGRLCLEADHCLLLSATPSRGDPVDFIRRLVLLDPGLRTVERSIRKKYIDRGVLETYKKIHGGLLVRRTKEYVNKAEEVRVFPQLENLVGIVEVSRAEDELFDKMTSLLARLLTLLGAGREAGLLRTILVKRALSSPTGFLKTLTRIVAGGRGRSRIRIRVDELIDNLDNYEPDLLIDELVSAGIKGRIREELEVLLGEFKKLIENPGTDSKALGLYELIAKLPNLRRITGFLVFTEYLDTLEYLYETLHERFAEAGYVGNTYRRDRIHEEALTDYCRGRGRGSLLCRGDKGRKVLDELSKYSVLLSGGKSSDYYLLMVSSRNKHLVPVIQSIIGVIVGRGRGITPVILATDVASEGFNLQVLNAIINYDVPWTPLRREQRLGRIYRLRQGNKCLVIDLVRKHWLELEIYNRLLLRLYGMSEQLLGGRVIGGIVYLGRTRRSSEYSLIHRFYSFNQLDESKIVNSVAEALVELEKTSSRERFREKLLDVLEKLLVLVKQYNVFVKTLEKPVIPPNKLSTLTTDIYGFRNHRDLYDKLSNLYIQVYRNILGREVSRIPGRVDELVVELYKSLPSVRMTRYRQVFMVIGDYEWDRALLFNAGIVDPGKNRVLYRFPVIVLYSHGKTSVEQWIIKKILIGGEVVEWLSSITPRISPLSMNTWLVKGVEITGSLGLTLKHTVKARIRARVEKWFNHYRSGIKKYWEILGNEESLIEPVDTRLVLFLDEYALFIRGLFTSKEPVMSASEKCLIEKRSLEILEPILLSKGYTVLERHPCEPNPYDLLVKDENGEILYIEVKAHLPPIMNAILSSNETRFAEIQGHKYIVCLVTDIASGNPLVVCKPYPEVKKEYRRIQRLVEKGITILYF